MPFSTLDPGSGPEGEKKLAYLGKVKRFILGAPRNPTDKSIFQHLSVVAFLAWVGLGADGLSSSCYGPEEAFRTLGEHTYLAVALALAMAITVSTIAMVYSRVIELFPFGGGGYVVATSLIGEKAGVISGAALLVDYVLTITVSIAASGDAMFSFLPASWYGMKLPFEVFLILFLTMINIRGVRESILTLLPIFLLFLLTHMIIIVGGIIAHISELPSVANNIHAGFNTGLSTIGATGMLLIFIKAYSMSSGTYTGIEAVSNGLPIMREPRVRTGKRTMIYMAVSLAFTASGLILCYLLWHVTPVEGKTMNAVLIEKFVGSSTLGYGFVIIALISEGMLLMVGAQAGFIGGPRVLSNMAVDSWVPRRFASLSERLTTRNGILLMGAAALAALLYAGGHTSQLIIMYSINVFLTFSITAFGMCRHWYGNRKTTPNWKKGISIHVVGLVMCLTIFLVIVAEKFAQGGWVTIFVTAAVVLLCLLTKRHYRTVYLKLQKLYASLTDIPPLERAHAEPIDPDQPTAAVMVSGYGGLGIHTALAVSRLFPGQFKNFVFISTCVIDSNAMKSSEAIKKLEENTRDSLKQYVRLFKGQGVSAAFRMSVGTDVVDDLEKKCLDVAAEFPKTTFFAGQLVFQREKWYQPILHNQTAYALQKRLQLAGHTMVIIPAKV